MTRYPTSAELQAMRDAIYREDAWPGYMHPPAPGAWLSERYRGIGWNRVTSRTPVAFADIAAMRAAIEPYIDELHPTSGAWSFERIHGIPNGGAWAHGRRLGTA